MEYVVSNEPDKEAGAALDKLLEKNSARSILLLLSGGSAFSFLEYVDTSLLEPHVTLGVLDERFSTDPMVNNFAQLCELAFYRSAVENGAQHIDTRIQGRETCEEHERRWEGELRAWKEENPEGVVLATMGVGEDGHTAGIMPNVTEPDMDGEQWVVSYSVPAEVNAHTERVTTTYTFLRDVVDHAVVFVSGDSKRAALSKLLAEDGSLLETPARVIHEMSSVQLFSDISI